MMVLNRADLEVGRMQAIIAQVVAQTGLDLHVLTETELQTSLQQTLQKNPGSQVWLFAYGSLIWNPIIHFAERQTGMVYGLHRRFCLWTALGRGTPDNPGLVLGLDRGGSCRGILYRIAPEAVQTELLLVWRREMIVGSYVPRWVKVVSGNQSIYAIAFTMNRSHPSYAGNIPQDVLVKHLATASGVLGSSADYLHQTIDGLAQANIYDRNLQLLQAQVIAKQQSLRSA